MLDSRFETRSFGVPVGGSFVKLKSGLRKSNGDVASRIFKLGRLDVVRVQSA